MYLTIGESISDYSGTIGVAIGSLSGIVIALINKSRGKVKGSGNKISYLKDHDVFSTIKRTEYEVANMKFYTHKEYDRVKTRMCYDFTRYKAKYCTEFMSGLLDVSGIDTMPKNKLKALIIKTQLDMHIRYIKAIRDDWDSRGIPKEDVDYIVHLFETFRYDVVNSFEHRINSIFSASYHKNNFDLMLAIFEMWAMGIDLLPRDMQTTFENLNGKFKDIDYEINR